MSGGVPSARLKDVLTAIDDANRADPKSDFDAQSGKHFPAALIYGHRMSTALEGFHPEAGEHLRLAARAQHIERWTIARTSYPEGRAGYLKWRADLKKFHGERLAELMAAAGYDATDCSRAADIVEKKRLRTDPDAQALEDVACLVFLEFYAEDFVAKYDDGKVVDILTKTLRKMSEQGIAAASKIRLGDRLAALLGRAVEIAAT